MLWYSASQALAAGTMILAMLAALQAWRARGCWWLLGLGLLAAMAAPLFWSAGYTAGLVGSAYLWADGRHRCRLAAAFPLAASLATALVVGVSLRLTAEHVLGDALAVGAAVFYGGYMLCVKHLRRSFSTATILAWSGLASVAGLLLAALLSRESLLPADSRGWLVLIALALVSQVAGQGLIAYAFAHLPVSFSSLSLLLQPAVAALLAWFILHESLRPLQIAGGCVILGGIALATRASR